MRHIILLRNTERTRTMGNVVLHVSRLAQQVCVSSRPQHVGSTVFERILTHIMDYSAGTFLLSM